MTSSSNNLMIIQESVSPVIDEQYPGQLYKIATPGNLLWLINSFNDSTNQIKYIKLLNNIDMRNQLIEAPLINITKFIFDGDFKTISNINCSSYLINQIDEFSIFQNVTFNNYTCDALININNGTIINCKFNNGNCKSSGVVSINSNLINNCRLNNIKLTTNALIMQAGVIANTLSNDIARIESCRINNIDFIGNGFFGGIVGNLLAGYIINSSVSNIRHENISSQTYKVGGICGKVSSLNCFIEKCNVDINTDINTSIIIGKIINSTVNIKCLTLKTKKGDVEDNKIVNLKYNRVEENKKREIIIKNREAAMKATEESKEAAMKATEESKEAREAAMKATEQSRMTYNKIASYELFNNSAPSTTIIINNYILFINLLEGVNTINMNNIFKMTSENKLSKLDYSYIMYDDIPCSIELPKIPLSKTIDTTKLDTIKNNLINNIKQTSLIDVNISSVVEGSTLYITITDAIPTVAAESVSTTAAIAEPVTIAAIAEPVSTAAIAEPVTTAAIAEPVTIAAIAEPVSTAAIAELVSTAAISEPVTTAAITEPVTTAAITEPVTTAAITEPVTTTTTIALAEHFESTTSSTGITDVVYVYNTSNNTAIMDAVNSSAIDPAVIADIATTSVLAQASGVQTTEAPQITEAQITEPQITEAPIIVPQITEAPIIVPQITEAPIIVPQTTEAQQTIYQVSTKKKDSKSNNYYLYLILLLLIILIIIFGLKYF